MMKKRYIYYSVEMVDGHKKYVCKNLQFATYNELLKAIKPRYILKRRKGGTQAEEDWHEENEGIGEEL